MTEHLPEGAFKMDKYDLAIDAVDAKEEAEKRVSTLLVHGGLPQQAQAELAQLTALSADELEELTNQAAVSFEEATTASGIIPEPKTKQRFLRRRIGEELYDRMNGYIFSRKFDFENPEEEERVLDKFMATAKMLLLEEN